MNEPAYDRYSMSGNPDCPCGSGKPYSACCGPLHTGAAAAPTAEALMRSRFSAFARGDAGYLSRTWHASTRPEQVTVDRDTRWLRLEILDAPQPSIFQTRATVEFAAHFRQGKSAGTVRERSRFVYEAGRWWYVNGSPRSSAPR